MERPKFNKKLAAVLAATTLSVGAAYSLATEEVDKTDNRGQSARNELDIGTYQEVNLSALDSIAPIPTETANPAPTPEPTSSVLTLGPAGAEASINTFDKHDS